MTVSTVMPTLTSGPIGRNLIRLSAPMLLGILSMMLFNLIDTFFVSRLGTLQLAALTLTFPVIMVVSTFTIGLSVGAMAVISQSIGQKDLHRMQRLTTDALSLTAGITLIMTIAGLATIDPLFRFLGATADTMPFVKQYMIVWYMGMVCYSLPTIGNNLLRATGDTLTPSIIMIVGMAVNAVLDPLFIFGWGPVPPFGITGAAIASVIARGLTMVVALQILIFHKRMVTSIWTSRPQLFNSWKTILVIGLPVAFSNAIMPLAIGLITRVISQYGPETVAGFGVATRIEALGFSFIIAMSTAVSPFVGQNFGAGNIDRIAKAISFAQKFSLVWGAVLYFVFLLFGKPFVLSFDTAPAAVAAAQLYLWIVSASIGARGIHQILWTALNVLNRPYHSFILEGFLFIGLWLPGASIGARIAGIQGIYIGLTAGNCIGCVIAAIWVRRILSRMQTQSCKNLSVIHSS